VHSNLEIFQTTFNVTGYLHVVISVFNLHSFSYLERIFFSDMGQFKDTFTLEQKFWISGHLQVMESRILDLTKKYLR